MHVYVLAQQCNLFSYISADVYSCTPGLGIQGYMLVACNSFWLIFQTCSVFVETWVGAHCKQVWFYFCLAFVELDEAIRELHSISWSTVAVIYHLPVNRLYGAWPYQVKNCFGPDKTYENHKWAVLCRGWDTEVLVLRFKILHILSQFFLNNTLHPACQPWMPLPTYKLLLGFHMDVFSSTHPKVIFQFFAERNHCSPTITLNEVSLWWTQLTNNFQKIMPVFLYVYKRWLIKIVCAAHCFYNLISSDWFP